MNLRFVAGVASASVAAGKAVDCVASSGVGLIVSADGVVL